MSMRGRVVTLTACLSLSGSCCAAIVYDAITDRSQTSTFIPDPTTEQAQELLPVGGGMISNVEMIVRNTSTLSAYAEQITVRFYAGDGNLPSVLLGSQTLSTNVPASSTLLLTIPFDATTITSSPVWLSVRFPAITGTSQAVLGIRETELPISPPPHALPVGSSRAWNTRRALGDTAWLQSQPPLLGGSAWSVRVNAVPAPASSMLLITCAVIARRRRS